MATLDRFRGITVPLDMANSYIPDVRLNAGDINGRTIRAVITDQGLNIAATGLTVKLAYNAHPGQALGDRVEMTAVTGESTATFQVKVPRQAILEDGNILLGIEVWQGSDKICSRPFTAIVDRAVFDGTAPTVPDTLGELEQLLKDVREATDAAEEATLESLEATQAAKQATEDAKTATTAANQAATAATTAAEVAVESANRADTATSEANQATSLASQAADRANQAAEAAENVLDDVAAIVDPWQEKIEGASQDAQAAQASAAQAAQDAQAAREAADSKTRTTIAAAAASGGEVAGDLHLRTTTATSGLVSAVSGYTGSAWQNLQLQDSVLSSVSLSKLASGSLTQAAANSLGGDVNLYQALTRSHIPDVGGVNMLPNTWCELQDNTGWASGLTYASSSGWNNTAAGLPGCIRCAAGQGTTNLFTRNLDIYLEKNQPYLFEVWLRTASADASGSKIYIGTGVEGWRHTITGNHVLESARPYVLDGVIVPNGWTKYEILFVPTTGGRMNNLTVYYNHSGGTNRNATIGMNIRMTKWNPANGGSFTQYAPSTPWGANLAVGQTYGPSGAAVGNYAYFPAGTAIVNMSLSGYGTMNRGTTTLFASLQNTSGVAATGSVQCEIYYNADDNALDTVYRYRSATRKITVSQAGMYRVWLRVQHMASNAGTMYVTAADAVARPLRETI